MFIPIDSALEKTEKVRLRGWIKRKRSMKENIFLILRDGTNVIQCVVEKNNLAENEWNNLEKALIESAIEIEGNLISDKRAPNGKELHATSVKIVSYSEVFPIGKDLSETFLLDVRHLWLRSTKMNRALKLRSELFKYFREFFDELGYIEVQAPNFVSGAVEGGSTLFEVSYFGKKVFLTQSAQFYLEAYITSLEKVYTIAPSFRAEKSRTRRHFTEYWHAEWETAWMNLDELIGLQEKMIQHICSRMVENHSKELKEFGRDPKVIEKVANTEFEKITYDEAFLLAQKKFPELNWGDDLGEKEERELTKDFDVPIFVYNYPASLKPFYHRLNPDNEKTVLCTDLLAPEGYGEIIGSGERCYTTNELVLRMKAENLDPKEYDWYVDLRRYGGVQHSGGGLGLARLLTWIAKLPHIRDIVGFPRNMNRTYP